jgi:thymidylate kinase
MLHPRLQAAFAALDACSVEWCLIRLPKHPEAPTGDIDLLVSPDHTELARGVLASCGFVAVPGWTDAPTLLFADHDSATGCWLLLEVETALAFGRDGELGTDVATHLLARRQAAAGAQTLHPDDDFWVLLLHCVLDKHGFDPIYRERLKRAARGAGLDGPLTRVLGDLGLAEAAPSRVRELVRAGEWDALVRLGTPMRRAWLHRAGLKRRAHDAAARVARAYRRLRLAPLRRGLSVAILGADGAGKSTLARDIAAGFPFEGMPIYMGLWPTKSRRRRTVPGKDATLRPFAIWSRYLRGEAQRAMGHLVVFDRYTYDAELPPRPPFVGLKRLYFWLIAHAIPSPQLLILLDAPAAVLHERRPDVDPLELERDRASFLRLTARRRNIEVVDASRPGDAVRADVSERIWRRYAARWAGVE